MLAIGNCTLTTQQRSSEIGEKFDNYSDYYDYLADWSACEDLYFMDEDKFANFMYQVNLYAIPFLVAVGISTNVLSILVFTTTHLRMQSSSVYLVSLAVAETVYLLALFVGWFSWIEIHLFHRQFWCQAVVYITYVCSFISVWNVASFTVERYLVVCHPLSINISTVSPGRNRKWTIVIVIGEALLALVIYSYSLITSGITEFDNIPSCETKPFYVNLIHYTTQIDSFLTLVLPSLVIVLLNMKLYVTVYLTVRGNNAALISQSPSQSRSSANTMSLSSNSGDITSVRHQIRTTRMLLVVSTVFILLNLPNHAMKIYIVYFSHNNNFTSTFVRCEELFNLLYYINFSINFFLYSVSRKAFRDALIRMFGKYRYKIKTLYLDIKSRFCESKVPCRRTVDVIVLEDKGGVVFIRNLTTKRTAL